MFCALGSKFEIEYKLDVLPFIQENACVFPVLNNEDEAASNPFDPSQVFQALRAKRWVITSDEQVRKLCISFT